MLLKHNGSNLELYVFKLDNNTFEMIGEINQFTSLIWPDKFNGYSSFELNAPITHENKNLIKEGNVLWCGRDNACIIEIVQSDINDDGQKTYKAKGRTLEMLLTTRIIWGTYRCLDKFSSTAMYEIVNEQCVNPSNSYRKIPFLECADDELFGKKVSFQKTGGEVYDALLNICSDAELGFAILFRPKEKKLIFKVLKGTDRTVGQIVSEGASLVIFSTDLEDIMKSSYYANSQDVKTTAYVVGEGEGADRVSVISGEGMVSGFLRKELYVDARDLQSEVQKSDGTVEALSQDEYNSILNDRGNEKLAECVRVESFEATMRTVGNNQYTYDKDYFKGDKVIIQDTDLGVQVAANITEITENYGQEYELIITYGYSYPTLLQKIKQQIL